MNDLSPTNSVSATAVPAPSPPLNAPTYTAISASSLTLNNVPALSGSSSLPIGITVSGAGSSADNGSYIMSSAVDVRGNAYYSMGTGAATRYIYYSTSGAYWLLGKVLDAAVGFPPSTTDDYYSQGSQTPTSVSLSSWSRNTFGGAALAPVPSFAGSGLHNPATSLEIQRALESSFTSGQVIFANVTPSTDFVDETVAAGTTYYYRYVDVNSGGSAPGPYSFVATATPITAISVKASSGYVSDYGVDYNHPSLAPAPQQYDGITTSGGSSNTGGRISIIWELGKVTAISGAKCWMSGLGGFQLSWSNDGMAWSTDAVSYATGGATASINQSGRYFRFTNFGSGPVTMFETSLVDGNGVVVKGPGVVPVIISIHSISGIQSITF